MGCEVTPRLLFDPPRVAVETVFELEVRHPGLDAVLLAKKHRRAAHESASDFTSAGSRTEADSGFSKEQALLHRAAGHGAAESKWGARPVSRAHSMRLASSSFLRFSSIVSAIPIINASHSLANTSMF